MTMNAQNMENALTPRRQGLAVIAALEAKGDQAGLENAGSDVLFSTHPAAGRHAPSTCIR